MDAFVFRKRHCVEKPAIGAEENPSQKQTTSVEEEDDSTDMKVATLASLFPHVGMETLLDLLTSADGCMKRSIELLRFQNAGFPRKRPASSTGFQASLTSFQRKRSETKAVGSQLTALTRKGATLHLYAPEDIAAHTPCSIIHNFLPTNEANEVLMELLEEARTFGRQTFKVFDNVVQSPHSACFVRLPEAFSSFPRLSIELQNV